MVSSDRSIERLTQARHAANASRKSFVMKIEQDFG